MSGQLNQIYYSFFSGLNFFLYLQPRKMVIVAQLVRAPDCGSGGRRFESGLSPETRGFFPGFFI